MCGPKKRTKKHREHQCKSKILKNTVKKVQQFNNLICPFVLNHVWSIKAALHIPTMLIMLGVALTILFFLTILQGGTGSIIFLLVPRNTKAADFE